jgi:hypothetical protein
MPSLFKTVGAVLCLVFALGLAAPNAVADEFVYTVTLTLGDFDFATQFSFIEPTLASSGDVTSLTQISGDTATEFVWNSAANGVCSLRGTGFAFGGSGCAGVDSGPGELAPFTAGSFLAVGTYVTSNFTVNIAQTGVPEPSSLALMLSGVGLVFGMRKRWTSGLQQAS